MMPRSILVLSGRYHIISNASLVNNCIIMHSGVIDTVFHSGDAWDSMPQN